MQNVRKSLSETTLKKVLRSKLASRRLSTDVGDVTLAFVGLLHVFLYAGVVDKFDQIFFPFVADDELSCLHEETC